MLDRSRSRDRSKTGGAFSPAGLFVTGAQGAWYDPSDFSTLFQNSTGTTPVTAVEQPVRLMLDRSGRGNNATAPNDASRPVLRARYNLLTFSEQFDNAAWLLVENATVSANATAAPDGTTTADKLIEGSGAITFGSRIAQAISFVSGTAYTFLVFVKQAERNWCRISFPSAAFTASLNAFFNAATGEIGTVSANTTASVVSLANGWFRVSITATATGTASGSLDIRIAEGNNDLAYTGDGTSGIYIWGADLKTAADEAATGGAYQRIAAATDYDTSNPVFRPYLAFDGTDDSFGTSAIDFSGTDEMTVFAGLTKLSDAATALLAELSASVTANNGSFYLAAPGSNGATDIVFIPKGTTAASTTATGIAAPSTSVVTGLSDISRPASTIRINGAQVAQNTATQGTGNFGNHPLFIGARNNASFRFNGRLYSLAVLGRTATAAELSAMEAWVNGKTGAY